MLQGSSIAPARRPTAARMAELTPATRDRYVDFLRAVSIAVVVLGHWIMAVITLPPGGTLSTGNALAAAPPLRLLTWALQVMPLFFFVGGFSNAVALAGAARRGDGYTAFVTSRARRLLRPTAVFIGVWLLLGAVPELTAIGDGVLRPAARALAQPLWFLGIYLVIVALAPAMLRLHRRFGVGAVVALGATALLVDALRVPAGSIYGLPLGLGLSAVGTLNFALVWLFAHQLGLLYADGALVRCGRRALWTLTGGGLLGLTFLTGAEAYPASMVGLPGDPISNMNPPNACIIALTCFLVGLAMLLRDPATALLARPRPWAAVISANSIIMTVYLWHLTALVTTAAILIPAGFPQPSPATPTWWALRPLWLTACTLTLSAFVLLLRHFEQPPRRRPQPPRRHATHASWLHPVATTVACACLALGILGFTATGFSLLAPEQPITIAGIDLTPLRATIWCLTGVGILAAATTSPPEPRHTSRARTPEPTATSTTRAA
jgi:hypothetical protein